MSTFLDGLGTEVNEEGIAFYNDLINTLLEKGIYSNWNELFPLRMDGTLTGWLLLQVFSRM